MRIFLTGGSGYIGGALAARLVEEGHAVRALVRRTSRRTALESLGVDCVEGDILEARALGAAMAGSDWVVHAAAELDLEAPLERMRATNVRGSEAVASAALAAAVPRFLQVSSIAAFGGSPPDGSPATEETPVQRPLPTRYCLTKYEGERAVETVEARGLALNVVYPSLVYGPPGKGRGANVLLRDLIRGRVPFLVGADRRVSWVFLEDLVDGLMRVLQRAPPGRRYLMTGETRLLEETISEVCRLAGARPPTRKLPIGLVKALAPLLSLLHRFAGRRPLVTREMVRSIERHWDFDDSRARRELDWRPRGLDAGLPPTLEILGRPTAEGDDA